jgi:hypothetical protein
MSVPQNLAAMNAAELAEDLRKLIFGNLVVKICHLNFRAALSETLDAPRLMRLHKGFLAPRL